LKPLANIICSNSKPDKQVEKPVPHITRDGSHTLYSSHYGQYYHNPNGAIRESIHIFFDMSGLTAYLAQNLPLTILETGFGTGLNFLLLLHLREKTGHTAPVIFQSVDAWPPDAGITAGLNYPEQLGRPGYREVLASVFGQLLPGANNAFLFGDVSLRVFYGTFENFDPAPVKADFVFHDPFSPVANPEMWTSDVFGRLAGWSAPDAVLATYASASSARAAMAHAGWLVARCPGVLGKREMSIASRMAERLEGRRRVNEERLAKRYEEGEWGG
jgi:tRNA U34 5-methylaminomethyl-2-thiouridine-forming methyltransferase MnmC